MDESAGTPGDLLPALATPHGAIGMRPSLPESHATVRVPENAPAWRKFLAYFGPGLLIAVGYMDPGNWATDLAGGARFGYLLLSVVLISNLMAMLLQHLALKLGVVTGRDLAQMCRARSSKPWAIAQWLLAVYITVTRTRAHLPVLPRRGPPPRACKNPLPDPPIGRCGRRWDIRPTARGDGEESYAQCRRRSSRYIGGVASANFLSSDISVSLPVGCPARCDYRSAPADCPS